MSRDPTRIDRAWRLAYWLGYRLARTWWRIRRPDQHGAIVAIWLDGRVLAVRQSYKAGLTFPGGTVARGEPALQAAMRELHEELGLRVEPHELALACRLSMEWEFREDDVHIFELRLAEPPTLMPDNREIVAACFLAPHDMLAERLPPFVRAYLLGSVAGADPAQ